MTNTAFSKNLQIELTVIADTAVLKDYLGKDCSCPLQQLEATRSMKSGLIEMNFQKEFALDPHNYVHDLQSLYQIFLYFKIIHTKRKTLLGWYAVQVMGDYLEPK